MKIYTKTGDLGETSLMGGMRVHKDDLRIHAYGDVDELNAVLGLCRVHNTDERIEKILHQLQIELFDLGSDLATPLESPVKVPRVQGSQVERLEQWIDKIDEQLEPLQNFILPGGSELAAKIHIARTICRRAERKIVTLQHNTAIGEDVVKYVNRLSDLLFVMARWANKISGTPEEKWHAR